MVKSILFVAFYFALLPPVVHAQSLAYKAMLNGFYDPEFPVVRIDQVEVLDKAVFLDTRERSEFDVSHIKGAKWVGYDTFSLERVKGLPKDRPIVVYCSVGARSQEIGQKLQKAGFTQVYNLYGGIFHWVNEGKPVYSGGVQTQNVHAYNLAWGIWLTKGEKVY